MQPALFGLRIFPPPSSGADIFTRHDSSGAGLAADTRKSLVVKLVVWNFFLLDKTPDILMIPINERIDFDELVGFIPFYGLHVMTRDSLAATQPGYPGVIAF